MSKVFQVKPKRLKRSNGTVLTPDMVVTVTTMQHTATPFYNGAKEVQEAYMRIYAFDYKKACCNQNDFEFKKLDEIYPKTIIIIIWKKQNCALFVGKKSNRLLRNVSIVASG